MPVRKKIHRFYIVSVTGYDFLYPLEHSYLINNKSFCIECGDPLYPISELPDISIKKMFYKNAISYISHPKSSPVHAMKLTLLDELSRFVRVEDYLKTGNLQDANNNKIENYCTFLVREYLFIRGRTFYKKKCKVCKSMLYHYYIDPYLPSIMNESEIPLFGCMGGGLVVNTEIGSHLKSLKMPGLRLSPLKIQDELPQNERFPLYKTFF